MREIAILTYDQKHRKTYDTLCLLKSRGYQAVKVYAQSMTYIKKRYPLINHRPEQITFIPKTDQICKYFDYEYIEGNFNKTIINKGTDTLYLLCGAGLLDNEFVKKYKIINSHPGYIPYARGLDAYKWSIYYDLPIGVTTHFLGDYIDAGEVIEQREISIKKYDTFHSVAQQIYENEIDMLVNAIELADKNHKFILPESENIFGRMSYELEERLLESFENYKIRHVSGK